ncbi:MAG: microcystin degradation protein MlrC [Planctomycetota bacterium]|nr:MAG: microcystin degradation protein MlrC [Planctomycetota bacterium]
MLKILINECIQEVSSFNPISSNLEQFQLNKNNMILEVHAQLITEVSGALNIFDKNDIDVIPGFSARAMSSGGLLPDKDFEFIAANILTSVEDSIGQVDGYYFALHGAMQSPSYEDPEGWLLEEVVKRVGCEMPIVISLDMHGILTEKMCQNIWAFSMLHTYPHVDFQENGERSAKLLLDLIKSKKRPCIIDVPIPALVRGDELITETGLLGTFYQKTDGLVQNNPAVLAAGLMIGNPFTDVLGLKSHVVAICEDKKNIAAIEKQCSAIAEEFWSKRNKLQATTISLADAFIRFKELGATVVFADAADATSSGASGDSNAILEGVLKFDPTIRTLLPILDDNAAANAHSAGVGSAISVHLGGSCDPQFSPTEIKVEVLLLTDGRIDNESHGGIYDAGPTALLKYEGLRIIVFSKPIHLFDRSIFISHKCNPKDFEIVVVKSPHTQFKFFSAWVKDTLIIDVPGATSANLKRLGHKKCERPIFPLDVISSFTPLTRCYQ